MCAAIDTINGFIKPFNIYYTKCLYSVSSGDCPTNLDGFKNTLSNKQTKSSGERFILKLRMSAEARGKKQIYFSISETRNKGKPP